MVDRRNSRGLVGFRRSRWLILSTVALLVLGAVDSASAKKKKKKPTAAKAKTAEDLLLVDCLLPGQTLQLGNISYPGPRQPARITAIDCRIRGGEYVAFDRASFSTALEVWQPKASSGDPVAQNYVGEIYERGLAGAPDYELAALWYERAAEQGHARAQVNLAHLYDEGRGVEKDPRAARLWFGKAAGLSEQEILDAEQLVQQLGEEVEALREQLEAATRELDEARVELQRKQDELGRLRQRLEAARAAAGEQDPEQIEALESEIEKRGHEVAADAESLEERQQALEALRARLVAARARSDGDAVGEPTIEIIRPDVLTTRGPAIVPVPAGVTGMEVRGRVTAPAGVRQLTVGERLVRVDDKGLFRTEVPFAGARREVEVLADDRLGRQARITLVLQSGPAQNPSETGPATPGKPALSRTTGDPRRHALIIGIAEYDRFNDLKTAERDAERISEVLDQKYGFQTVVLRSPSRFRINRAFVELIDSLTPEDDLVVYYAGHGRIETGSERGFWIPSDADPDEPRSWLPNEAISDFLEAIPARRVLVISDSCYSGTLARAPRLAASRSTTGGSPGTVDRRSRNVLTSGGLQPVLDEGGGGHSLFAAAFLRVLELFDESLPGEVLHRKVAARVVGRADELGVDQVPSYAPIHFAGHEAGDFVLAPMSAAAPAAPGSR